MGASAGENDHWQFELAPAVAGSKGAEEETTAAGPAHAAGSPKQQSFYEKPKGKKSETWQGAWSSSAFDFSGMVHHRYIRSWPIDTWGAGKYHLGILSTFMFHSGKLYKPDADIRVLVLKWAGWLPLVHFGMLWLLRWVLVDTRYPRTTISVGTERMRCNNAVLTATAHARVSFICKTFAFPLVTFHGNRTSPPGMPAKIHQNTLHAGKHSFKLKLLKYITRFSFKYIITRTWSMLRNDCEIGGASEQGHAWLRRSCWERPCGAAWVQDSAVTWGMKFDPGLAGYIMIYPWCSKYSLRRCLDPKKTLQIQSQKVFGAVGYYLSSLACHGSQGGIWW